ncbi:hypothetical protein FRC11_007413, partial [Ceratobasidium sp. 423]
MIKDPSLPLWAQQAANHTCLKLNKHYSATDSSHLYRIALLLNPSMRIAYLRKVEWKEEWIAEARTITLDFWAKYYKPEDYDIPDDATSQGNFGYSSFVDELYESFAQDMDKPSNPVLEFIEGKVIIEHTKNGKIKQVDPLAWWYAKKVAGEDCSGLTQMAIDVLTIP